MNALFIHLCALLANPPAPGEYVTVCGLELQYVGKVEFPDADFIAVRGHVFLID